MRERVCMREIVSEGERDIEKEREMCVRERRKSEKESEGG